LKNGFIARNKMKCTNYTKRGFFAGKHSIAVQKLRMDPRREWKFLSALEISKEIFENENTLLPVSPK
jgi:hypothetical protein